MRDTPPAPLPEIIDRIIDAAAPETVDLDTLIRSFGRASFTPILLLPAIAVATPLSGIPLFSTFMGLIIFLVSVQMILQRRYLWLPGWLLRKTVQGTRVQGAFRRVRPLAEWIERHTAQRFRLLTRQPFVLVPQALCMVSGLMMPLLEFVPFSSSVVGVGVAILALGILTRDGVVVVLGLLPYAGAAWLVLRVFG